jgi:hypothetical protein
MSVHVELLSGKSLSFDIFEGYNFRNLRAEIYNSLTDELSIRELECIIIFDDDEHVILNNLVEEGKTYKILINQVSITFLYSEKYKKIIFDHDYQYIPDKAIINVKISEDKLEKSYNSMYNELDESYKEDIEFFRNHMDENEFYYDDYHTPTFQQYLEGKYGTNDSPTFEILLIEYIKVFVSKFLEIEDIVYQE